jgi:hypothetical protein
MGRDGKKCDYNHYTTVYLHANYIQAPLSQYSGYITVKRGSLLPNVGMQAYGASNVSRAYKVKMDEYGEKLEFTDIRT